MGTFDTDVARWHAVFSQPEQHRQFAALRQAVLDRPGAVVVELGGGVQGLSTTLFLSACEETGGELWSVDLLAAQPRPEWPDLPYWHFLQGDDLHPAIAAALPAECDVLFIDSDHSYDHTLAELRLYARRVRPGGAVLLHDTQWDEQGGVYVELPEPTGPVARALNTWCQETGRDGWENLPGSFGLGTVRF